MYYLKIKVWVKPRKEVQPMVNISIFRSPIEKPVLDKERPEIIRRVANS